MKRTPELKDLHIRITSKCNMNCPHCYAASWFKDKVELNLGEAVSAIAQAIDLGCSKITFTGGEPLTYPFIAEAVTYCLQREKRVELETNGLLVDKFIESMGQHLKDVEFSVSYDGPEMRGKADAIKVRKNITSLVNLGCKVKVQTVFTRLNVKDLQHILEFSRDLHIKNRVFLAHSPNGNGANLSLLEMKDLLGLVKKIRSDYPHAIIELPDVFSGGAQKKCGWGVHRCEVMPNGDITSCGPITFNKRGFIAGNIKMQLLADIWNSPHFSYIRSIKQSDFKSLCSKCEFWKSCLGACRSISSSTGGDLLSPHPFCVSVYNMVLSEKIDKNFIPYADVYSWVENIQRAEKSPCDESYESLVIRQHKLT